MGIGYKFGPNKKKNPEISEWYDNLVQPQLRPPKWIFAPVWTYLYSSMGVASWFVLNSKQIDQDKKVQLSALYATSLVVNFLWTPIFFGSHKLGIALVDISCLLASLLFLFKEYYKVNSKAGLLFYRILDGYHLP